MAPKKMTGAFYDRCEVGRIGWTLSSGLGCEHASYCCRFDEPFSPTQDEVISRWDTHVVTFGESPLSCESNMRPRNSR